MVVHKLLWTWNLLSLFAPKNWLLIRCADFNLTPTKVSAQPCRPSRILYLKSWRRFGPLSPGGLPLVGGPLEVEARVHPEPRGQQVVHHHDAHVLRVAAVAVQTEELGQQRPRVLEGRKIVT